MAVHQRQLRVPSASPGGSIARRWQRYVMSGYQALKRAAIQYWERRRIIYNVLLVPPSVLTYALGATIFRGGDGSGHHHYYVVLLFLLAALGANICYTFAYVVEFFFLTDTPSTRWLRFGRTMTFALGVIFSIVLAIFGGREIALMEFYYR
jgi:hypothetical protein